MGKAVQHQSQLQVRHCTNAKPGVLLGLTLQNNDKIVRCVDLEPAGPA